MLGIPLALSDRIVHIFSRCQAPRGQKPSRGYPIPRIKLALSAINISMINEKAFNIHKHPMYTPFLTNNFHIECDKTGKLNFGAVKFPIHFCENHLICQEFFLQSNLVIIFCFEVSM